MIRFQIVVFNYERIASFLNNFDKISNFDPAKDQILIFDCSRDWRKQKELTLNFAKQRGWEVGNQVKFVRRRNWGIDQGARIEYLETLLTGENGPEFIWQFQEHYLDLESPWSIWGEDNQQRSGQLKEDTIPDGLGIDLDFCEKVYRDNPDVSVIYADRARIGILSDKQDHKWFYVDGANFSIRTSHAMSTFSRDILSSYKMIFDASYLWTLFIEMDVTRRITDKGAHWFDLATGTQFGSVSELLAIENKRKISLHQDAEDFYGPLYSQYETKFLNAMHKGRISRNLLGKSRHLYFQLATNQALRQSMSKLGVLSPSRVAKKVLVRDHADELGNK